MTLRDSKGRYIRQNTVKAKPVVASSQKKNYIGISRDHSGSMSSIARPAAKDYNSNIASIQANSEREKQNTIVSVVEQGGNVRRVVTNSTV